MNLSDFETLEAAQAYYETTERLVSPDMLVSLLTKNNSVLTLKAAELTNNVAAGLLIALSGSVTDYDVRNSSMLGVSQQQALAYLVSEGIVTQGFHDEIIAYANNYVIAPFVNATQLEFNQAKKIFTEKQVTDYVQGKNLKITLNAPLPFNCAATTWSKDSEFDYENVGRSVFLKAGVTQYKIKLSGLRIDGDLFVRIPITNFDYTVEVI